MRKHLLLTTALVAISGATFPAKANMIINTGDTITNNDLAFIGHMDEDNHRPIVENPQLLQVNGGNLDVKLVHIDAETVEIKSGNVNLDDAYITTHDGEFFITGGNMTFNNHSGFSSGNMDISGNTIINLDSSLIEVDYGFSSKDATINLTNGAHVTVEAENNNNSSSQFIINSGTINMNGDNNFLMHGYELNDELIAKNSDLNGGVLNVNSGNNYLFFKNTNLGGTINIAEGAALNVYAGFTDEGDVETVADVQLGDRGMINIKQGGTINLSGTLSANIDGDDRGIINFNNSNAVIDGNVESPSLTFNADHSLSKAITGEIGSLDKLTIAKGTFNFDKEPTDTISTIEVANGATLDIGLNTLHSTGDKADGEGVLFKDNSTLKFTATSAENHGKILANYVNISSKDTTLDMIFNGAALAKGESMTIQLFGESEDKTGVEIEGKFATLNNNARYEFTDEGDGVYKITALASASDIIDDTQSGDTPSSETPGDDTPSSETPGDDTPSSETPGDDTPSSETPGNDTPSSETPSSTDNANTLDNNQKTAEAWDNVDTSKTNNETAIAISNKLAELSNKATSSEAKQAYRKALTALAPETAPVIQQTTTETTNAIFGAVGTRLSGGAVAAAKQGMSSGDNPFTKVAVWVQGLFNKAKLDDTSKSKGFDSKTYGTALGVESKVSEDVKLGIGYAYSKTDIDGFMRDTDVKTHTAILYGEYKPNNWYVNAIASYGWSDYDEKKNVAGIGVKADWDVESFALQMMTGYDMYFNGFGITPEAGLRYIHVKQDKYTDTAGQSVKSDDSDIVTGVLGAKIAKSYDLSNDMLLTPEFKAAMTYDISHDNSKSTVTLVNGSSYSVTGKSLNRFGVELGAGITAELNNNVELSLGYEGKFRKDYQDHTGLINAKYKF